MKRSNFLKLIILIVLITGSLSTFIINNYINARSSELPTQDSAEDDFNIVKADSEYDVLYASLAYTEKLIDELNGNNNYLTEENQREIAYKKLKYWEDSLEEVNEFIKLKLNKTALVNFEKREKEWVKYRDTVGINPDVLREGEYSEEVRGILSKAEQTKDRAYSLLEEYKDILSAR